MGVTRFRSGSVIHNEILGARHFIIWSHPLGEAVTLEMERVENGRESR